MLSLKDIEDILRIKLVGVVPESESVLQASNQGIPAIHLRDSDVAIAYQDVVARYLGEEKPLRFVDYEKPGWFKRLFGGRSYAGRVGEECVGTSRSRWARSHKKQKTNTT